MVILNHGWGRWWRILRRERRGEVWSQQQLIEDPVDSPCPRKLELVPCRPHLLLNHEGSCTFVVQLLRGAVHLQVPCVQPDQVPFGILLTWALAHIVAPLHCNSRFLHSLLGFSSLLCELGQPLIHCRVHFCGWADPPIPWVPPILQEEWCLLCCQVLTVVSANSAVDSHSAQSSWRWSTY